MSTWTKREPRWNWRAYLTTDEAATVARAETAKAEWQRLQAERAAIQNRAIHRAKSEVGLKERGGGDAS